MSLFDEILNELTGTTDLSVILRKAKVLGYKLGNDEFKDWVENELNGYKSFETLPEYRKLSSIALGDFSNGYKSIRGYIVPMSLIPINIRENFNMLYMKQGVKELESMLETIATNKENYMRISIPSEFCSFLHYKVFHNLQCYAVWRVLNRSQITQIIETTRNSLLSFILELADKYPEIKSDTGLEKSIPNETIQQVFNYNIQGNGTNINSSASLMEQEKSMTFFDQRNQKVNTQYNAIGDINFNDAQDISQFIVELEKLKTEFLRVAEQEAIDGEIVTDAEYQLTKAIQQSQKIEPDKKTIVDHLKNAKQMIDGVTVATGLINALTKAIEIANTIFN